MATSIQMPKLSDTMTEGTIQKWLVKEGDTVRTGDPIAEVETDKATLEMEAYEGGTILKILTGDGGTAAVGAVIAVVGKPGEDWQKIAGGGAAAPAAPAAAPAEAPKPTVAAPAAAGGAPAAAAGGKATAVLMPKLSDTMTEGTIQKWLVKEGQKVRTGDPIAEVETDKATLEMEAYEGGTVLKILVGDGGSAAVGGAIAVIGEPGANWQAAVGGGGAAAAAPAPAEGAITSKEKVEYRPSTAAEAAVPAMETEAVVSQRPQAGPAEYRKATAPGEIPGVTFGWGHGWVSVPPAPRTASGEKVRASPLARKIAAEKGVDLSTVQGTGPGGRITRADVEGAQRAPARPAAAAPAGAPAAAAAPARAAAGATTQSMSQMRKAIARNLQQAKRDIPHFYLTMDVDMAQAVKFRAEAKAAEIQFSVNDLILKAVAVAAKQFPRVQAQLVDENTLSIPGEVNLGVAVALEDGLITPVLRNAESMSIGEINRQVRDLAAKARDKKLKPEDYQGGTITVSNLGMYDIEHFYAIVNPPQASIVSVGKMREEPVVEKGQIVVGHRMRIGYSGDHRIVDGAVGAQFLQAVKRALENPMRMLVG